MHAVHRYPSLFRAHNLCYTTLLHPDDVGSIPAEDITTTPTGAWPPLITRAQHVLVNVAQLEGCQPSLAAARCSTCSHWCCCSNGDASHICMN